MMGHSIRFPGKLVKNVTYILPTAAVGEPWRSSRRETDSLMLGWETRVALLGCNSMLLDL